MKLVKEKPSNYEKIASKFNLKRNVVFTYGNILYAPNTDKIPDHLWVHEETHEQQQGDNPEEWWNKYLEDDDFRLEQELEAYRNQFDFIKKTATRKQKTEFLNQIAKDLSSEIYGKIIDYKKARELIRK